MPTYEYQCNKCNHLFEKFQSMSEKPEKKCPKCGGKVTRLISSGGGLIFKGSGFYATDYKKRSCPSSPSDMKDCASEKKGSCTSCPSTSEKK